MSYRDGLTALRARRAQGIPLDRAEIDRRFIELRGGNFQDGDLLGAYSDVFDAVCAPDHIVFAPHRPKCRLDCDLRQVHLGGDLKSAAGDTIGVIERRLDFTVNVAWHGQIIIAPAFRTVAIAAIILRHSLSFYEVAGIQEVQLTAALTTGTYYWAKLGFDFASPKDAAAIQHWFARVNARLSLDLDCRETRSARDWLSIGDTSGTRCSLGAIASGFPNERESIQKRALDNAIDMDEPLPAGKAILLAAPRWHGRLPVNRRSRTRVDAYIGARGALAEQRLRTSMQEPDNGLDTP